MKPHRPALLPDPAGLYGLVVFLVLVRFAGPKALHDGDTLWHIKVGQSILETGQLVTMDTYSHTVSGQAWIAHEWLAEVYMALVYQLGGLPGVAISFFLIAALSFNLLYHSARKLSNDWAALIAISLAAVPMAFTHLFARPHLFTWLLAAITLHALVCNDKRLWLLPVITALWGNLHGGVLLGLLLQGCFLLGRICNHWPGRDLRQWSASLKKNRTALLVLALSLLATGLNPFGFYLFSFNLKVSAEIFSRSIGEWKPADYQSMWYVRIWFIWMFCMAAWSSRRIDWKWALLLPVLFYQAMAHVRHISVAAMMMVPWLALSLQSLGESLPSALKRRPSPEKNDLELSTWTGPALTLCCSIVLLLLCATEPPAWQRFADERFPLPESYSQGAIDFIAQGAPGERLLNEYSWGDYLIYALDPPPPIFIDGRADMYGVEIFDDYLSVANLREDAEETLARHQIDWVVFPHKHPLVRYLDQKPGWETIYRDETTAILAYDDGADR